MTRAQKILEAAKPRVFYRGTNPGDTRRISTGSSSWDKKLFAADNIKSASMYGSNIETLTARPFAKILYENTREFRNGAKGLPKYKPNMLAWVTEVTDRAERAGYDAVWFERQTDIGTAIINPAVFTRN